MTVPLRLAPTGQRVASPATVAVPTCRVNPVVRGALYLYLLSIPFEIPGRTIPIEIPTLTGVVFLVATLLNPSECYRRIPAPLIWFTLHLWALAAVSLATPVEHRQLLIRYFLVLLQLALLLWAMVNLLADGRVLRGALLAFALSCAVRAAVQVLGIASTPHTVWTGGERVTAFSQNANLSAIIMSGGLVLLVGLQLNRVPGLPRLGLLTWPLAGLLGAALIQTGSRGGLACAGVGLVVLLFTGRTLTARLRNGLLGSLMMVALAWGVSRSDMMRHRFEAAEEGNLGGREQIYPALLEMFRERPLLGWGPIDNQFEIARRIGERQRASRDAHNLVLEVLTTSGVVGALPFLVGLALTWWSAWRARHGPLGVIPLALLAAVMTGTVSGTWIASKVLWLALTLAVAAGAFWRESPAPNWVRRCAA